MRLVLAFTAITAGAALAVGLGVARPAQAQGSGMNCYANTGGRSNCGLAANALMNRLNDPSVDARRGLDPRHLEQVRGVDQAIKAGHCEEAVALARKSGDRLLAASAARICATAPDADPAKARQ
jgi:hypothetical protein